MLLSAAAAAILSLPSSSQAILAVGFNSTIIFCYRSLLELWSLVRVPAMLLTPNLCLNIISVKVFFFLLLLLAGGAAYAWCPFWFSCELSRFWFDGAWNSQRFGNKSPDRHRFLIFETSSFQSDSVYRFVVRDTEFEWVMRNVSSLKLRSRIKVNQTYVKKIQKYNRVNQLIKSKFSRNYRIIVVVVTSMLRTTFNRGIRTTTPLTHKH